jgi:mRNA interferase RelE/StbE
MLKLKVAGEVTDFVRTRPPKHQKQIVAKIQTLRDDANPPDSKQVKGSHDYLRADVGEYRIMYRVDHDTLHVALVGKRNDEEAYRRLGRKRGR